MLPMAWLVLHGWQPSVRECVNERQSVSASHEITVVQLKLEFSVILFTHMSASHLLLKQNDVFKNEKNKTKIGKKIM